MDKEIIRINKDNETKLPIALAVKKDNMVYVSGIVSKDYKTGALMLGTIEEETDQVLRTIKKILELAGSSMEKIMKTTVFLTDMNFFDDMNKVYGKYFKNNSVAARSTVGVQLVGNFKIEIEAVAFIN